jgi:hypothetical protein
MITLYEYARARLNTPGRKAFINVLLKKSLRSISRTSGHNMGDNRWMRLIDLLAVTLGPTAEAFEQDVLSALVPLEKKHKQGCLRMRFMITLLAAMRNNQTRGTGPAKRVMTEFESCFSEDNAWFTGVLRAMNYVRRDCGHYESAGYAWILRGTEADPNHHQSTCGSCAEAVMLNSERTRSDHGTEMWLLLTQFVRTVHSAHGSTIIDSRVPPQGVTYNLQHQLWHDESWTPYRNLIDGYHSSRQRGFAVIDSPWYRLNRRAFGCELEVQVRTGNRDAKAGRIHEALNPGGSVGEYCFFERDGSIGDNGFEIVTQPAGLDVHREKFDLILNNLDIKRGLRSHEGGACGFHVHVGREFLTQGQIYRLQSFLNDVRNEALIRAVARRYSSGYCAYKPELAKFTAKNKHDGGRYEALNVQNRGTVEFRIFRGSLRYESIIAALEFCNALLTFCTPGVTSLLDFTAVGFKRFIQLPEHKRETKFLRSYLSLDTESDNESQHAA